MTISVSDPTTQNIIFFILLGLAILLTTRKRKDATPMSIDSTTELKGLAILSIILAHIGFGLASDNRFLQPLSTWAGTGVNIFFFLSGFGLTTSAIKKDLTVFQFYWKRLSKILIPLWLCLIIVLILDKLLLGLSHPTAEIIKSFLGFFPRADMATSINSPLWYLTPLIFYYLLFHIIFIKKIPEITALLIGLIAYYILQMTLPIHPDTKTLWELHYLAFPLGILFASIFTRLKNSQTLTNLNNKLINKKTILIILRSSILCLVFLAWLYFFKNSGVGEIKTKEQLISLIVVLLTCFIFILKPIQNKFLYLLGVFSYEIYLFHWPLLSRYDFLFQYLPAWLATFFYLILFILLGMTFNKTKEKINKIKLAN